MKYHCSDSLAGKRTFLAIVCSGLLLSATHTKAAFLDFEEIAGSLTGTLYGEDTYLGQGVRISSGSTPQTPLLLNDVFVLGDPRTDFYVYENPEAVSGLHSVGATGPVGGNPNDVLLTFSTPVSFISLRTDHSTEQADIVQLVGLMPTGNPFEFRVTAVFSAADNALSAPFDTLSLSSSAGFTHVLFQQTTDLETFDDLSFTVVPEPGVLGLLLVGGLALGRRRRR